MKLKNLKSQKGFTIIEVLIVLAIAGLIMGIVFVAVPALQRNGRNTQRRSDINIILNAINEVVTNSNGQTSALSNAAIRTAIDDLSYYEENQVAITTSPAQNWGHSNPDIVRIAIGFECNPENTQWFSNGQTSNRSIAVAFAVETGGNATSQCLDS